MEPEETFKLQLGGTLDIWIQTFNAPLQPMRLEVDAEEEGFAPPGQTAHRGILGISPTGWGSAGPSMC